jgi:hypothetical protein
LSNFQPTAAATNRPFSELFLSLALAGVGHFDELGKRSYARERVNSKNVRLQHTNIEMANFCQLAAQLTHASVYEQTQPFNTKQKV